MNNFSPKDNPLFNEFIPEMTFDYHGFGSLTAHEIEYELRKFIEEAKLNKYRNLLIITGKGEKVKPQVQKLLRQNKFVASFKLAGYFNGQSGAFEVVLKK